ncbi:tRNA (adenosine(37)-N6)-threonylcarbamoyltransferase complex dimerization subunit type 1 TsaB [Asticcacaulis solisilvae]|uniref:tRNA (adenosine(37)-N6)-threonylcarbamoyltransferase complex dimerization subunit type 1 TsaB n=1 Tax=Asticcacaulis solisilvae TaxID=1217274 RepID=UPI003FD7FC46
MSLVLVIDTSLHACSVGLFRDGAPVFASSEAMQRGHQERLGPLAAEALERAGVRPRELTHLGVTLGPGSFTGLRVGLSFAKGLAVGLNLPLQGIGTLEALGHHPDLLGKRRVAVIDGGRGQIYIQVFDGETVHEPRGVTADSFDVRTDVLTGPGAHLLAGDAPVFEQGWPMPEALAALTLKGGHDDLTPLYMREADAVASTRGIISISS